MCVCVCLQLTGVSWGGVGGEEEALEVSPD